jgi:hypothetical protein
MLPSSSEFAEPFKFVEHLQFYWIGVAVVPGPPGGQICRLMKHTPSVSDLEVVLDKVMVKHWEYKSSIIFKWLSLQM